MDELAGGFAEFGAWGLAVAVLIVALGTVSKLLIDSLRRETETALSLKEVVEAFNTVIKEANRVAETRTAADIEVARAVRDAVGLIERNGQMIHGLSVDQSRWRDDVRHDLRDSQEEIEKIVERAVGRGKNR